MYILFILAFGVFFPSLSEATIRYVDATAGACTGNYSITNRNCSGSDGTSYATVANGAAAMVGGDILKIRTGTYVDHLRDRLPAGTVGSPTIVQAYCATTCTLQSQYEVVTLRPSNGGAAGLTRVVHINGLDNIQLKGLILDGVNGNTTADDVITSEINGTAITGPLTRSISRARQVWRGR